MGEYSREQRSQLSRAIANNGGGNRQLKGFVDNRCSIQMMSVGGVPKYSSLSGSTRAKHLVALGAQQGIANNAYTSSTFFTSDTSVRNAVDTNVHNFPESPSASARYDIYADIPIYLYSKAEPGVGNPTTKTIDGADTQCEIGTIKNGLNNIVINHFKKA